MWQALFQLLKRHASADWTTLAEETLISLTGLCRKEVPAALVQQAGPGRSVQDSQIQLEAGQMSLDRWQPYIVCILFMKMRITFGPEVSLPSDSWLTALQGVHNRKTQSYSLLITDLQLYVDSGWKVKILQRVTGAREWSGSIC